MREFLELAVGDFEARGTLFMASFLKELIDSGETSAEEFDRLISSSKERMMEVEKFSILFQYYLSLLTYLVDLKFHYEKSCTASEPSV